MRILALDHGLARIGCAVCDPTETIVRPIEVIEPPDLDTVAGVIEQLGADMAVVGLPRTLRGRESEQAGLAREFGQRLRELVPVPVELYDERLTTRMAQATRRAGAGAAEDSIAAAHLLESYLISSQRQKVDRHG